MTLQRKQTEIGTYRVYYQHPGAPTMSEDGVTVAWIERTPKTGGKEPYFLVTPVFANGKFGRYLMARNMKVAMKFAKDMAKSRLTSV